MGQSCEEHQDKKTIENRTQEFKVDDVDNCGRRGLVEVIRTSGDIERMWPLRFSNLLNRSLLGSGIWTWQSTQSAGSAWRQGCGGDTD